MKKNINTTHLYIYKCRTWPYKENQMFEDEKVQATFPLYSHARTFEARDT